MRRAMLAAVNADDIVRTEDVAEVVATQLTKAGLRTRVETHKWTTL